ncbi:MAG TPA: molybdenum cofactor guanylyltransferase [Gallionella sp.]|nr:molybdenum cofactor guanylyltransferase [Gallionella sp.]
MIEDCTGLILAGGDSRRMGRDKANLLLGEQTLLLRVANVLQCSFPRVVASVRQPHSEISFPQVCDDPAFAGPLAGLAAGLASVSTPWVFAVACDMPFLTQPVIERLAGHRSGYQAVVPVVQGHLQPLAAFYAGSCLEVIRNQLAAGNSNSLRAVLKELQVCYVGEAEMREADPTLRSFFDLDTPDELAEAEKVIRIHNAGVSDRNGQ